MKDENAVTKHTPGPWHSAVGLYGCEDEITIWGGQDPETTCYEFIAKLGNQQGHDKGNASLIKAAPDMLAALKAIKKELQLSGNWEARDYGWPENRKAIEAAIDKAEGR